MVITLSGDDSDALTTRLSALYAEHLPGDTAAFNLLELDGSELQLEDLRSACDALPFLGDTRVVVVKSLLRRFSDKEDADGDGKSGSAAFLKDLKRYLPSVPPSTVLIFVERRKLGSSAAANALRAAGTSEEFGLPAADALPAYIVVRARERGVEFDRAAAGLLAAAIGDDPQRLGPELDKLLAYKAGDARVTEADVRALVDIPLEVAVWDLTDALYAHDGAGAVRSLRALTERGQAVHQVMGAVASQLRNLVVAEEYRGASPEKLASATGMKPFVARKSLGALRHFKPGEARRLLRALMELDLRSKTGKAELNSALELFLLQACARAV